MRALVVGGGVAGPACAIALRRVGIEAVVLERRPASDPDAGSYLTVAPNGLAALDVLGVLEAVREGAFPSRSNRMVTSSGRLLGELSLGRPLADGTVALTLKRSALADVLAREAAGRGVQVRYGARVASVDAAAGAVVLEDGERLEADVVVGADGVRSLVRRAVDPSAPEARYVGLANFGGITRATPLAADLPDEAWHFVFGRRAFFGAHRTPSGDVVWFVNVPRDAIGRDERATTSDAAVAEPAGQPAPRATPVRPPSWCAPARSSSRATARTTWRTCRPGTADAPSSWATPRTRPRRAPGQGASLALEDAVVLAACAARPARPRRGVRGLRGRAARPRSSGWLARGRARAAPRSRAASGRRSATSACGSRSAGSSPTAAPRG